MSDYDNVPVTTQNTLTKAPENTTTVVSTGMAAEQSRSITEVQAALTIAKASPRDEDDAFLRVERSCKRRALAERAGYAFKRGGQMVEGPSIRLAETLIRCWGNATYGFRVIGQAADHAEVESFCWDLETNTKAVRQFRVKFWRDTKGGGYGIKEERDKYEIIANMAQRRVRACILEIVPGDLVDTAMDQCAETLKRADPRSLEEKVRSALSKFDEIGVTKDMIETHLQHAVSAITESQLISLGKIYQSIKDGVAKREEFFDLKPIPKEGDKQTAKDTKK